MKDVKRAQDLIGSEVYDQEGDKIGRVGNVYVDDATHQPEWVTVRTGMFGTKETFVPLAGASSGDKGINVGVTKNKIKDAPKIATQHGHLSDKEGQDLYSYYGLQRGTGMSEQSSEQVSQDSGSDKGSGAGMATGAAAGGVAAGGAAAGARGRGESGSESERMSSETADNTTGSGTRPDMPKTEADVPTQSMSESSDAGSSGAGGGSSSGGTSAGAAGATAAGAAGAGAAGARSSSTSSTSGTSASETRSSRDTSDTTLASEDTTSMSSSGSKSTATTASASPSATAEKTSERESTSDSPWRMRAPDGGGGQHRAEESSGTGTKSRSGMSTSASGSIPHEMTRSEERLRVDTENVESGRVHMRKYVVTEQESVTVPLSHEEVRIERYPITDAERSSMTASSSSTMEIGESDEEIVLHAERPVVNKESVPVERVTVNTEMVTEEQTIRGEVRKEQFDIDDSSGHGKKGSSGTSST